MAIGAAGLASIVVNLRASGYRCLATTAARSLASAHSLKNHPKSKTSWSSRKCKSLRRIRASARQSSALSEVPASNAASSPDW